MIAFLLAAALGGPVPCAGADIHASKGMLQGATGTMLGTVDVRNVSSRACALGGRPRVQIVTRSGRVFATRQHALPSDQRRITLLRPNQAAVLNLDWSNWCGSWTGPAGSFRKLLLRVTLTTGPRLALPLLTGRPRCDQPRSPSTLYVSAFTTA